jgi:hypothetical protein
MTWVANNVLPLRFEGPSTPRSSIPCRTNAFEDPTANFQGCQNLLGCNEQTTTNRFVINVIVCKTSSTPSITSFADVVDQCCSPSP